MRTEQPLPSRDGAVAEQGGADTSSWQPPRAWAWAESESPSLQTAVPGGFSIRKKWMGIFCSFKTENRRETPLAAGLPALRGCAGPQEGCVFVFYGFPFYFPVQSSGQARRLCWVRCGSGRAPQRASSSVCPSVLLSGAGLWGWRGGLAPKCCKSWGTPSHPFPPTHFQARQKLVWAGKRGKAPPHSQGLVSPTWLMGPKPGAAQPVPCPQPGFNLRAQPRLLGLRVALGTGRAPLGHPHVRCRRCWSVPSPGCYKGTVGTAGW